MPKTAHSDERGLLSEPVEGTRVSGAVMAGKARKGNMEVIGHATEVSDSITLVGKRYTVANKLLQSGETFQSEPGALLYMSDGVTLRASFGGWRMFSGEGLAKNQYTNNSTEPAVLALTPNMPMGSIIPFDLSKHGRLNCKRGAFMAAESTVRVHPKLLPARSALACCFGGVAPVIQEVSGTGLALLAAGGTILKKSLAPGETILVDTHSVVAFTSGVSFDVKQVGSLATCCFAGEGCFNTELSGPGTVYFQSLSYEKLTKMLLYGANGINRNSAVNVKGGGPPDATMER